MSVEKHFNFGVEGRDYYLNNISFEPSTRLKYDLSTIEIDLGRRKGHTSFISKTAKPDDIIIIPTFSMIQNFKNKFFISSFISVVTPKEFIDKSRGRRDKEINSIIWIDNWQEVILKNSPYFDSFLYNYWCFNNVDLIVKLG